MYWGSPFYREICRNMFEHTEILSENANKYFIEWNFEDFQVRPEKWENPYRMIFLEPQKLAKTHDESHNSTTSLCTIL